MKWNEMKERGRIWYDMIRMEGKRGQDDNQNIN